ncbi:MAG: TIGR03087 family PEP-CTERM/XrtA system glycosyltransferase [Planctomycetota bacterium]
MKILYLCHRIPYPPNKGDKIRSMYQIRHLAQKHEVHLLCLADQREDLQYAEDLRAFCHSVEAVYLNPMLGRIKSLFALLSSRPLTLSYFSSSLLMKKVRQAVKKNSFDVAVAYSSGMIPYRTNLNLPRIIDFVDLDSQKWVQYAKSMHPPMSWIYRLEGRRLFHFEKISSEWADASIVVTSEEGEILEQEGNPKRLCAVPLGVDLDYYRLDIPPAPEIKALGRPVLIFVGNMDYRPNYEAVLRFARVILPHVARKSPEVLFLVVGANPPSQVLALDNGSSIKVTGKVLDTRPYLSASTVSVVPLSMARGIQTKVLESMAMELPVVLTHPAALGVNARNGRDYIVADDDADMADQILRLIEQPERAKEMAAAGRRFVKEKFAWGDKLLQYEKIIEEAVTHFSLSRNASVPS